MNIPEIEDEAIEATEQHASLWIWLSIKQLNHVQRKKKLLQTNIQQVFVIEAGLIIQEGNFTLRNAQDEEDYEEFLYVGLNY